MSALAFAQLNTALGADMTTFTDIPKFNAGSYAYLISEYPGGAGTNRPFVYNPYRVLGWQQLSYDDASTERISGSVAGTEATGAVWPSAGSSWYFVLQNVGTNKITQSIHGSLLTDLAGVRTLVGDSATSGWADPA